jgi:hypothetical protein
MEYAGMSYFEKLMLTQLLKKYLSFYTYEISVPCIQQPAIGL